MKIYLGSDHAGFYKKQDLSVYLESLGKFEIVDCGAFDYDPFDDYPDFIKPVAKNIVRDLNDGLESLGFIFGGSGQGEAIVANRINGVRACVYYGGPREIIQLSKQHNNANILSFGARFLSSEEVVSSATLWLNTNFTNEKRHVRRIGKIDR